MKKFSLVLVASVVTFLFVGNTAGVFANSEWANDHPRRHHVNKRLNNQNQRINEKAEAGAMSIGEEKNLHLEDRAIRQEERDMARQNDGHVTKGEQKVLYQQENAVNREIGK